MRRALTILIVAIVVMGGTAAYQQSRLSTERKKLQELRMQADEIEARRLELFMLRKRLDAEHEKGRITNQVDWTIAPKPAGTNQVKHKNFPGP